MAQVVGKYAAQKLLGSQFKQYADKKVERGDDPYFALIPDPKRLGKTKKVKKQIPAYIPDHDALILASAKKSAYRLDMCLFNLFGIRFGWEAVIGIIPFAGDAVGVAMALLVMQKCASIEGGLPSSVRTWMLINILIDFAVGLVPFIGDLADAAFKCNTKNVALLEKHLDQKYRPGASGARREDERVPGVDREQRRKNRQSGIFVADDPPPATVFEEFSDDEMPGRRQETGRTRR
ncbi:hypothetical protein LTR62_000319 [Meristemomyces frigidus]|uniref:PH domain-containing protein n=1 Tax=Meristemomyces frigidus TaxID=1508187 RepID=A0AAN7TIT1_9PEZI|nr:hypothetical protein LTR62_000319 [Meristemomyces frigidus]